MSLLRSPPGDAAGPPRERLTRSAWRVRGHRARPVRRVPARKDPGASAGPPAPREEGSDVQAWTQAARPQEERRQPRQAAERLTAGAGAPSPLRRRWGALL